MAASSGTGPVLDSPGLFHASGSYCGQFMISATSDSKKMPDPAFCRQHLQRDCDERLAAAEVTA